MTVNLDAASEWNATQTKTAKQSKTSKSRKKKLIIVMFQETATQNAAEVESAKELDIVL